MIELYLDTVDSEKIARLNACLPLAGVTTNPSILAKAGIGIAQALLDISAIIGEHARFHLQVVSESVDEIVDEAFNLASLPYDIVVKIPATEVGLAAIKIIKQNNIKVLATAIYSSQQGFLAALCGADYLAPYVNRMDTMGNDGVLVVSDLQQLITLHELDCKLLPASFKNTKQVMDVIKIGVQAITIPEDIAIQMISHPAVKPAVVQFNQDWSETFGSILSFES